MSAFFQSMIAVYEAALGYFFQFFPSLVSEHTFADLIASLVELQHLCRRCGFEFQNLIAALRPDDLGHVAWLHGLDDFSEIRGIGR